MKLRLAIFLAVLTVIRLAICGANELSPDEAYYYMWSQRPDLSYYSKGPGVAMTILASTKLFGATEFGVRFFSPLLALGTSLIVFALAKRLYDEKTALWVVLLIQCIPIFNAGSLVMTIDPLSIFFWSAGVLTFWLALEKSPKFSLWWIATGFAIGLGALCKYTNLAAFISMIAVLLMVPAWRSEWKRPGIYISIVIGLLCLTPPVIWNAQHNWITLGHLSERGGLDSGFSFHPVQPLEFLAAHLGVYSPLIFGMLVVSLFVGIRAMRTHRKTAFLIAFSVPLIAIYFGLAFKEAGEANWTAPAMVTLAIFAVHDWLRRSETRAWANKLAFAALALGALISVALIIAEPLRTIGVKWPYAWDPGARLRGWKETGKVVGEVRKEIEAKTGAPVFLIANKYQVAASLAWYLPDKTPAEPGHPPVYIPESQVVQNQFSFWPSYDLFEEAPPSQLDPFNTEQQGVNKFIGRNALYVTDRAEGKPASALMRGFARWEYVGSRQISLHGMPLREMRFFVCYDYQTLPL